jgi:hypothetical protein
MDNVSLLDYTPPYFISVWGRVLVIIGALFKRMAPVLWVIARQHC